MLEFSVLKRSFILRTITDIVTMHDVSESWSFKLSPNYISQLRHGITDSRSSYYFHDDDYIYAQYTQLLTAQRFKIVTSQKIEIHFNN